MRIRSILPSAVLLALALASSGASAGVLSVSTYSMFNGDGTVQAGTFDYLDGTYQPNVGNAALTPDAALSGGTGLLTDGIAPIANWSVFPNEYVGWKYSNPTITFNFASNVNVGELDLYMSAGFGLSGLPAKITVNGTTESFTTTPWGPFGFVDKLAIIFGGSGLAGNSFAVQLFEGACSLNPDCANYQFKTTDPFYIDPRTGQQTTFEPWLMLSEAQFLSAVPESSTWAMMLIGFAAAGFVAYRRQKRFAAVQAAM